MKFKFTLTDKKDPTRVTEEETFAATRKDLENMYAMLYPNMELKIIDEMGDPGAPKFPQGSTAIGGQQPPPKSPPKEIKFADGDCEYKIVDGVVFKRMWLNVGESDGFRIVNSETGRLVGTEKYSIQKLDWARVSPAVDAVIEATDKKG